MPFENKNRVTDKNVGSKAQNSSNVDFTRQCIRRMLKEAKESPSTSKGTKVHSLKALLERNGSTAPGSEIPLTDKGLLGGWNAEIARQRQAEAQRQREAHAELVASQATEQRAFDQEYQQDMQNWSNSTDRGRLDPRSTQLLAIRKRYEKREVRMARAHQLALTRLQNTHRKQMEDIQ